MANKLGIAVLVCMQLGNLLAEIIVCEILADVSLHPATKARPHEVLGARLRDNEYRFAKTMSIFLDGTNTIGEPSKVFVISSDEDVDVHEDVGFIGQRDY